MGAVELLEQHHAGELVGQRHLAERQAMIDAGRGPSPNGPPITKHRSRPLLAALLEEAAERERVHLLALLVQQRHERALGQAADDLLVLADLDLLEPHVAGEQLLIVLDVVGETGDAAAPRPRR